MKIEFAEEDNKKYWGIWVLGKTWLCDASFRILAFASPELANIQHDLVVMMGDFAEDQIEVREIT